MRRAEGVVDVQIGQRGQRGGKIGTVFGLPGIETQVFQQNDVAALHAGHVFGHLVAAAIGDEFHRMLQQLRQPHRHRAQGILTVRHTLRPPQMRHQDHSRAVLQQIADRRQGGDDTGIVLDHALLERHIEIHAHDHGFVFDVNVFDRLLV